MNEIKTIFDMNRTMSLKGFALTSLTDNEIKVLEELIKKVKENRKAKK